MRYSQYVRTCSFWIAIVLAEVLFIYSIAQCQISRKNQSEYSLTDPKYNSIILAHVGSLDITAEEFLLNYEFGPAFPKREKDSKQRYLNFMIYEKLIALDGYANGLQNRSDVQQSLKEIEGDLITTELYKDEVVHGLKVSKGEIEDGVKKESVDLSVQWIFSPSEIDIRKQKHMIDNGVSFDSLYGEQLNHSVNKDDRMMGISRFKLEERNPLFASMIDKLKPGEVSSPFYEKGGWYIVRYVAAQKSLIITQTEEMKIREDVKRVIIKRKSDSLSDSYIQRMLVSRKPVIVRTALNNLMMILAKQILPPDKFSSWRMNELTGNLDIDTNSSGQNEIAGKQLVQLMNGSYSVNDFLSWYQTREMNLKLDLKGPQEFFASLEPFVWRMVRDKLLIERAVKKGLQRRENVLRQKKWWEEKLVYQAEKEKLEDSIPMNDSLLFIFYTEHVRDYKDSTGSILSFQKAKEDIRHDYYSYEVMNRTVHRVLQLKQKYAVAIQKNELNNLYVDTENQPRAIDVYAVKTGGTFPRPAFPCIDYEWQSWN